MGKYIVIMAILVASSAIATSAQTTTASADGDAQRIAQAMAAVAAKRAAATQPAGIIADEIAELRSQLAALKAENARLREQLAKLKAATTAPAPAAKDGLKAEIEKAITEHRIVNGMTVEQANKALSLKFIKSIPSYKSSASSNDEIYSAIANWKQTPIGSINGLLTGGDITGTLYTLTVTNGVISFWSRESFHQSSGQFKVTNNQPPGPVHRLK